MERTLLLLLVVFFSFLTSPEAKEDADLLIRGGRILDGTGAPAFAADIAIRDGRIIAMGKLEEMEAHRVIDSTGRYVAPGFIDLHSHADQGLFDSRLAAALNNVSQGITTVVVGQDGRHAWPVGSTLSRQAQRWRTQGVGNNVIPLVGQGSTRLEVIGWEPGKATQEQMAAMERRVQVYLAQGAWGISTGLSYVPGRYSSTGEVIAATRPVRKVNGFYISHLRNQADFLIEAIDEMLQIARKTGVRVVATHIKAAGRRNWGKAGAAVQRIAKAREAGIPAYADLYPYETSSDGIDVSLVDWSDILENGDLPSGLPPADMAVPDLMERIHRLEPLLSRHFTSDFLSGQPAFILRAMLSQELLHRARKQETFRQKLAELWKDSNRRFSLLPSVRRRIEWPGGPDLFQIERHPDEKFVGLNLAEAARLLDLKPEEAAVQLTLEGAVFTEFHMSEEDVITFIRQPFVAACTDGWIPDDDTSMTHPRSYGAFTRRLRRYVSELEVIDLSFAVRTATGLAAEIVGLTDRGYVKPGQWADLIVFDPERVRDRATFRDPHRHSEGIDWVLINGEIVVENGKPNGRKAGRVLLKTEQKEKAPTDPTTRRSSSLWIAKPPAAFWVADTSLATPPRASPLPPR